MGPLESKIQAYKTGREYSSAELEQFVIGYVKHEVSDDLMTKFIKSIFHKPLTIKATSELTRIMMHSGDVIHLGDIPEIKVDKHSTGGVGDKVTLIVAPLVASLGACFAKMSGRGLGFSGGTLDKLESIPGYNIFLSSGAFKKNLREHNIAIIGQTENLVPADKKIYALRDATNLIASIPLIASSIMSKKLATGADAILIDVKIGDAAFLKTQHEGEELARWMIAIGQSMGRNVQVIITSMATPLGYEIGNKNEVLEAIRFLEGKEPAPDLKEVVYSLATTMLGQAHIFKNEKVARQAVARAISKGWALAKFRQWITSQGGAIDQLFASNFWHPQYKHSVLAHKAGYFRITSAFNFGLLAMKLGAGRVKKEATIDHEAGISLHCKTGDFVQEGGKLFTLYSSRPIRAEHQHYLKHAYVISRVKKNKKTILNKL